MRRFINRKWLVLGLLFILGGLTRFWRLDFPSQSYFDEVYYVPAARLMANNDPRAYEWWHSPIFGSNYHDWLHPPVAKLLQAGSIKILGDTPFAWRLPSALASLGVAILIFKLALKIFADSCSSKQARAIASLASLLFLLDGLALTLSRIAMNDMVTTFFMLLGLWFLLQWQPQLLSFKLKRFERNSNLNLLLTGIFLGLALATKWSAVFLIVFFLLLMVWLLVEKRLWRLLPLTFFSLVMVPFLIYITTYSQMFAQGKSFGYFLELHQQVYWYQTTGVQAHRYHSEPLLWLTNLRPVWLWTDVTAGNDFTANIYALGNPVLQWLAVLAVIFMIGRVVANQVKTPLARINLSLLMLYGCVWLPWLVAPRPMFYYHYLPAIPFLMIILAEFLVIELKKVSLKAFWLALSLIIVSFSIYLPHWLGFGVPKIWADAVYFGVTSWR